VPFPDELARGLAVVAYDRRWPGDFAVLARRIQAALGPVAVRVNHVGSTSVPGLAAKDCIDIQVDVQVLAEQLIVGCFEKVGFRLRPEPWNHVEAIPGGLCPKLVFAPPEGERASNIHVLEATSEAARRKLLFRDFLRAHDPARDAWSDFKQRLAAMAADIYEYGQAKDGPTKILMIAAENWARQTRWAPGPHGHDTRSVIDRLCTTNGYEPRSPVVPVMALGRVLPPCGPLSHPASIERAFE
jgi:GrpB-like predicted nucleotidyltransferase (UPF0157 family)